MFLNCHTVYSLRYGVLTAQELVQQAVRFGIRTLVLTDINNMSCALEFYELCLTAKIKPLLGIDFRRDGRCLYIGIAKNREGIRELNTILTEHSLAGKQLPDCMPPVKHAFVIYPQLTKPLHLFKEYEYLGVRPQYIHRLFSSEVRHSPEKLVALYSLTFAEKEDWNLHKILRAIDRNTLISKLSIQDIAKENQRILPEKAARQLYAAYPRLLQNVEYILNSCEITLKTGVQLNRRTFTGSKAGDLKLLEKLAYKGMETRYGSHHTNANNRVKKELKLIEQQDFSSYFLITWDIIRYAHSVGYHHVGRGSGANSIVAYCLYITDVNPLDLDLYFERFINAYRTSPPDFDIDFSWDERDDVTDYIFKRYGKEHVALLATYSTFQGRSTIREIGKTFGLPKAEIDKIVHASEITDDLHPLTTQILYFGKRMEGFPNYLSIHAGGILISEEPLAYSTALQMMPKGFPITQFDMHHAEDWGYHKFDILSQRGLGHIKDAVELIKKNQGKAVDIRDTERIKNDPQVQEKLYQGQCIGCFYIESPAMRGLLSKLKCRDYVHLVAASSIIRPGVAKSGMMKEYIRRFHAPNSFEYPHSVFKEHLGETFGVMVYQEDVIKIAHHFAGLGLGESDVLRRVMSGKKTKGDTLENLKAKFFKNCKERGHSEALSQEIWRQIKSFAGYSFCKAHSASYAVESFQSLYLKTYFPLEFIVAVINNFGGFYKTEHYFHEARMSGGTVHAPCINHSLYLTTLEGKDVYVGFIHLQGLDKKTALLILEQRAKGGVFSSLADFVQRVAISGEQLELLIRIGAFRFTEMNKYELMWEKNAVFNPKENFEPTLSLFPDSYEKFSLPKLEETKKDRQLEELDLLNFSIDSPFDFLQKEFPHERVTALNMSAHEGLQITMIGYYVCQKKLLTSRRELMAFGTWLDEDGHFFDTVHFPYFLEKFPFRGRGIYQIKGKVSLDFDFPSLEVLEMALIP